MASSISVAVRVRPLTEKEKNLLIPTQSSSSGIFSDGCLTSNTSTQPSSISGHKSLRSIVKVLDDRVLIFDPAESNPMQQAGQSILSKFTTPSSSSKPSLSKHNNKKVKDMRFCFDRVFNENASQEDVYHGSAQDLIDGVLGGFNATVFAYGATGCGKTHTITGTPQSPGIVYLLMKDLFGRITDQEEETTTEISISYLEIYNETIRDLLNPNAPVLNLREANSAVSVPGLSTLTPTCASDVISLISSGNSHRTVHGTEANAVSSRSHAVMSVNIRRKPKTAGLIDDWTVATLSVIDLAGSERASVTKNKGERLLEGANINKSLLALGNCINALCDPKTRGNHIPYRNSKLTRLLKHSLGGNCRTLMIVCVAPTSQHYDETHNTLQYANRAKEIKTKVTRNMISVDRHVSQYVQVIFQLRQELEERKKNDLVKEDRLRKEINSDRLELDAALSKAKQHWNDYLLKAKPASQATGKLKALEFIGSTMSIWNQEINSDPNLSSEIQNWLSDQLNPLLVKITEESSKFKLIIHEGSAAKDRYVACINGLSRTVGKTCGKIAQNSLDNDISIWDNEVGKLILDSFIKEGNAQTIAAFVAQIAAWLIDLTPKFFSKQSSNHSQKRFTEATKTVFQSFCSESSGQSSSTIFPSTSTSSSHNPFNPPSTKIDRSPPHSPIHETSNSTSIATKARRASSSTKLASAYYANRSSPRKPTIFGNSSNNSNRLSTTTTQQQLPNQNIHTGILKRSTSLTIKNPSQSKSNKLEGNNNGKTGGVRWRDVESDGEERLESFDRTGSSNGTIIGGGGTDESMLSLDQSCSYLADLPSHSSDKILSNSIIEGKPSPIRSSEKANLPCSSAGGGARINRMKAGYLSRNSSTTTSTRSISTLDSLGEEDEEGEEEGDLTLKALGNHTESKLSKPTSFSFNEVKAPSANLSNYPLSDNSSGIKTNRRSTFSNQSITETQPGSQINNIEPATGRAKSYKINTSRRKSSTIYARQSNIGLGNVDPTRQIGSTISGGGGGGLGRRVSSVNLPSLSSSIPTTTIKNEFSRRASRVPLQNSSSLLSNSLLDTITSNPKIKLASRSPKKAAASRTLIGASNLPPPSANTRSKLAARRSVANLPSSGPAIAPSHGRSVSSSSQPLSMATSTGSTGLASRPKRLSGLPIPVPHNPNFSLSSSAADASLSFSNPNLSANCITRKDLFGFIPANAAHNLPPNSSAPASSSHNSNHVWR
ncbi:hypothetical protein Pst134EA_029267 [Puccinia striiformis f. sp. tritici]|uniref:hypothetical protein n=1 Tax=Puccinia striiformis f. sp. tritici TaxID=168172 RepID=UPI002008BDF6|nr:hypothetical protein Pst134EA_029267 [Puccinia striiformis f. sp. tritici]KAH9447234.1 hypothetical protein Pst134EA_029267 [Puccinia striiformis f. sp. tritici]